MSSPSRSPAAALDRRDFVRLSMMTAALSLAPRAALGDVGRSGNAVPYYGALRALPPGDVRPEGWLRTWMQKQAAELGSHLPEVSWPFSSDYWGEEREGAFWTQEMEYEAWWPWEQRAYWIDGATRLALLLDDQALLAKATKPVAYTLAHPDAEGYLGPELFQDPLGDYHRWPHTVFFRSVGAAYDGKLPLNGVTYEGVLAALQKHYLNDTASYGKPKRNINNVEDMLWLYERTGNPRLLTLAENAWQEYQKYADDPENADLGVMRVFGDTPINAHGETYAETSKQPAILYMYTGKAEYLKFALADQRRMFDHHMLIDGAPSTSEWFSTRTALDSHETCDISDHTWSWGYMLQATGDAVWGDHIERACFNAAPGAIKKDWKALQYLSCPNQFLAKLDSDHNWPKFKEHGMGMMAFQPNPGLRTACCGGNVHRIFPNYTIRMWMKNEDGGLAAVLYGPSHVKTAVGSAGHIVEITQTTKYPFEETIEFRIRCDHPVEFPLSLRIPGWCDSPKVAVNGSEVSAARTEKGFATVQRAFRSGDVVTLTLPMKLAITRWPQDGIGVERGPLVYALPIEAQWTSKVIPRYSTAAFPAWEAAPQTAWNYGLALDEATLHEIKVDKVSVSQQEALDPWTAPPIKLTVPVRKIAEWQLQPGTESATQRFTPPLPDVKTVAVSETVEQATLVPYGSTHLRLTIFPAVAPAAPKLSAT